ncbi:MULTISPECIES: CPBP family intramembrane glutamic endopeptidase [unclassified Cyanobium]|uniref:CPBP family intramembrane glutamic endopeptidase n=1 Tax=unclassified Cyanobium TaxID=2627006 RepID=UPI0020CD535A|nr:MULTISPECIES: CPBP family intramembrane glutamic endopeptidase [unclassified Cyanobium]MCP9834758.1 CPBP family intramembrane metalloprotease [Cyanobium sp. La Preciosa 7G6]MCP9937618.1 CPBP family intramembrane metalloprotease [Cyanobium sp. Aljojuca 7A6]
MGTLLYVPVLYGLGWLLVRPLGSLAPGLRPDQVNLAGAMVSLLLLLLSLPLRLRRAWGESHPWRALGVVAPPLAILGAFGRGLLTSLVLLALVVGALLTLGGARWIGPAGLEGGERLNALALLVGVGFAEELVFRGWLWGELQRLLAPRRALLLQAAIFALVHPWSSAGLMGAVGLLGGLVLLGLNLALLRRSDQGILWGAVGLHGGLVGGWFALQAGLVELLPNAPPWLAGPGGSQPNPIGGLVGWVGLGGMLALRAWRKRRCREDDIPNTNG